MNAGAVKPSKMYYIIPAVILIFGFASFGYFLLSGIFNCVNKINNKVIVPGSSTIELEEPGKYTIYFEQRSIVEGKLYFTSNINGLVCSLRNIETGEYIQLNNPLITSNYSFSGLEGTSIFDFEIIKAGKYELVAGYESGEGEEAVLAINKGFGLSIMRTVILSTVTLLISIVASGGIFLLLYFKRKKAINLSIYQ